MHKNVQQEMSIIGSLETFQLYSDKVCEKGIISGNSQSYCHVSWALSPGVTPSRNRMSVSRWAIQGCDCSDTVWPSCEIIVFDSIAHVAFDLMFSCFVFLETSQRGCPLKITQHSNGVTFIAKQHFSFDLVLLAVWRYLNWIVLVHTGQESLLSVLSYHQEVFKLTSLGADLHADQQ